MVYLFLADGFEQIEALATLDIMRRAGIDVKTVAIGNGNEVKSTLGVCVRADINEKDVVLDTSFEGVVLPGGMPGAENLEHSDIVKKSVLYAEQNGKMIAAICASPYVLGSFGVLKNKAATCYPGFESKLLGAEVKNDYVVASGNVITAKGAGVSLDFGFAIAEYLKGAEKSKNVAESMQCRK